MHRAPSSAALMSHVRFWVGVPGAPLYCRSTGMPSPLSGELITAIQAAWLAAGTSLLPPCPHCGQLSQQESGTQGTWPHLSITAFPRASEGLGGGHRLGGHLSLFRHWGGCSFLCSCLCVISARRGRGRWSELTFPQDTAQSCWPHCWCLSSRQPIHLVIVFSLKQKISQA